MPPRRPGVVDGDREEPRCRGSGTEGEAGRVTLDSDQGQATAHSALGCAMMLLVAVALVLLLVTLFLLGFRDWDFEGSGGLRYLLLVNGTELDRIGLVAPTARPAHYKLRPQDGPAPGLHAVTYDSNALPSTVISSYAERCEAMGLRVTKRQPWYGSSDTGAPQATLECRIEIERFPVVEIHAERLPPATVTTVLVTVSRGL
jgi:hypothetical protein